eukprot:CAMPEP_0175017772 /NCGR_PEP_ID=MMETSP0005-20121125/12596_1 /TAXON_ID=420556 /ORGANISM="Ochromonas sp., Strain CCMP1393" /LENGTH=82 /DNA_ID=CAMNT_0016275249 /DNA_START=884 /DNA_END=1132 /DNA_ORIENTATION=-
MYNIYVYQYLEALAAPKGFDGGGESNPGLDGGGASNPLPPPPPPAAAGALFTAEGGAGLPTLTGVELPSPVSSGLLFFFVFY